MPRSIRAPLLETLGLFGLKRWIFALAVDPSSVDPPEPLSRCPAGFCAAARAQARRSSSCRFCSLGGSSNPRDARQLARWAVAVALVTAAVATVEYFIGVEPFFPVNEASRIIYLSRDIGESRAIRIPSTFSSAHAYGGTMVGLVPLLVLLLESRSFRERALGAIALGCAALGVFACGARLPFIGLLVVAATVVVRGVRRNDIRIGAVAIGAVLALTVSRDERLQRFETLSDSAYVGSRFEGSVNENLLEILAEHPMGRGLGSAVGTSIPYFLAEESKPQVGLRE